MRSWSSWALDDGSSAAWWLPGGGGLIVDESAFFVHTLTQLQPHLHVLLRDSLSSLQEDVES